MRDVAQVAGVSVTTVSHVINNTRPVSDELRTRVTEAMQELGYQTNILARSLRKGETLTVGVILPDSANPFFAEVARGVEDTSFMNGYSVILCNTDSNLEKERIYTDVLVKKQVDGILFIAAGLSIENIQSLLDREMPLVIVDRQVPEVNVDCVLTNNRQGGYLAAHHLINLGHRRIGCIVGPENIRSSLERLTGYQEAIHEAGLPFDETLIVKGDFQYESGYEAAQRLLTIGDPPSAIFAFNDLMAVGALSYALEKGYPVPAGLSVVGFDDVRLAVYANPPITTVMQPKYEIGELATQILLERMKNPETHPRQRMLETRLVVRKSTAPFHN
ncbi:MAG: LacI family DNA-binding transcriptional regulator [Anaerolineales bacterium]